MIDPIANVMQIHRVHNKQEYTLTMNLLTYFHSFHKTKVSRKFEQAFQQTLNVAS